MFDVDFNIESVKPVPFSVAPLLGFAVRITSTPNLTIRAIALRAQIQLEVTRRGYTPEEQHRLHDLFGEPERWGQTLRNMLWTHVTAMVPAFTAATAVDLQVPCSFDFNVAATKYFEGLSSGDLPLLFLFSGTVFYETADHMLQTAPISWEKEAPFRLPVETWRQMMDMYYPNSAWLSLRRDVFERLYEYKVRAGLFTWEQAIEQALDGAQSRVLSREKETVRR